MNIKSPTRLSVRVTATIIVLLLAIALVEAMSRVAYEFKDQLKDVSLAVLRDHFQNSLNLDPYEMLSDEHFGHWVLRPGFQATNAQIAEAKRSGGKFLSAQALLNNRAGGKQPHESDLSINQLGFKGPEIFLDSDNFRILMLGDSVTFGLGKWSYPRETEKWLNEKGLQVEVVNAGVEGYSPKNAVFEVGRYLKLSPDIVTILLGWNALFSVDSFSNPLEESFRTLWFFRRVKYLLEEVFLGSSKRADMLYQRSLTADLDDAKRVVPDDYFPPFMQDVEYLVEALSAAGTRVILMTLPGLFSTSQTPSEKAMEMGHLPEFTTNPFVLARRSELYNSALKKLSLKKGITLIDLEEWSREGLRPRDAFFSDSVHLTPDGMVRLAEKIGEELKPTIESLLDAPAQNSE